MRAPRRCRIQALAISLACALLAACGGTAAPSSAAPAVSSAAAVPAKPVASAAKENLTLSYSAATASQSTPWIAADEGFYDKYGLGKVDVKFIASGPLSVTALIGGDVDVAVGGGDALVSARVKGTPVVEIGSFKNFLTGALMARPGVTELSQVKKLSVSRIGSNTHYLAIQALKRNNIDPSTVTFIQSGSGANDVAALSTGQVDAASTVPPDDIAAEHQGAHLLLNMTALKIPYPASAILTTQDTLRKRPDALRRLLQALGAGIHVYFTNPERTQAIIGKWARLEDKTAIQAAYASEKQVLEEQLTPRPEALAALLADAAVNEPAAKDMKPAQLIDSHILDGLVTSGFFKNL